MSEIILDFRPEGGRANRERLTAVLPKIGKNDRLTLVFDRSYAHEADHFTEVLTAAHFTYQPKGGHNGEFYILARREL